MAVTVSLWACGEAKANRSPPSQRPLANQAPKLDHVVKVPIGESNELMQALQSGKPLSPEVIKKLQAKAKRHLEPEAGSGAKPALAAAPPPATQLDRSVGLAAQRKIREIYELVYGQQVQVARASIDSGMWRFELRLGAGAQEKAAVVYASGDGRLLFRQPGTHLDQELDRLKRDRRFARCLASKGVRIFGDRRTKATMAQLGEIGRFAGLVFIDCAAAPKQCAAQGARKLPAVSVGGRIDNGHKKRGFFEAATGCK